MTTIMDRIKQTGDLLRALDPADRAAVSHTVIYLGIDPSITWKVDSDADAEALADRLGGDWTVTTTTGGPHSTMRSASTRGCYATIYGRATNAEAVSA